MALDIPKKSLKRNKKKKKVINYKSMIKVLSTLGIISVIIITLLTVYIINTVKNAEIKELSNATIIDVTRGDVIKSIEGRGTIEAGNYYNITSLVNGDILKDYFVEGQAVSAGDLLYTLSHDELDKNIKIAQNDLSKAQELYKQTQSEISKLNITSQFDGCISNIFVKKGEVVTEGTPIAEITNYDKMLLSINFYAEYAENIAVGQSAIVEIKDSQNKIEGTVINKASGIFKDDEGRSVIRVQIEVSQTNLIKKGAEASATIGSNESAGFGVLEYADTQIICASTNGVVHNIKKNVCDAISNGEQIVILQNTSLENQLYDNQMAINDAQFVLDNYKEQLNNYNITAPISGKVVEKKAKAGEKFNSNSLTDYMARIEDLSTMVFYINVNETNISDVFEGQSVDIMVDAYPEEKFTGSVQSISSVGITNENITVYPVKIIIEKTENNSKLIPGMNVTATMEIDLRKNVLRLPAYAVNRNNTVTVINMQSNDKVTKEVEVEVGLNGGEYIEIISGITESDSIVIYGTAD